MRSATTAWVSTGLILALLSQASFEYLWILALGPVAAWAGAGVVIVAVAIWRLRSPELRRASGLVILSIAAGAVLFGPVAAVGSKATTRLRFRVHRTAYDRLVSSALATQPSQGVQSANGLRYVVDLGPPRRVAFPWPGGVIDNWCGAVYDPTGEVMKSNAFDGDWATWRDKVPAEVISLFGGDLIWCEELGSPYFHCCFT